MEFTEFVIRSARPFLPVGSMDSDNRNTGTICLSSVKTAVTEMTFIRVSSVQDSVTCFKVLVNGSFVTPLIHQK